jgi:serine/threonine-protein kinase RsbW
MSNPATMVIQSDPEKLFDVDEFAEKFIVPLKFSQDQRDDIAISLSEAVNNAIEHGNSGDISKRVYISLQKIASGIKIVVEDEGGGFDESEVADPTDPENLLAESGRGLLIIHHLMDSVQISNSDKGTLVELVKEY